MAIDQSILSPDEGELVVCTVTEVKQNGAYVTLDEYAGINGFIFIGEVASGWIKNIRGYVRDGQRLICKVLRTRRDGESLELSLKSVSEERRRDRLQVWKNEQRAVQLFKVLGEKQNWDEEKITTLTTDLTEMFETLYGAFEEAALNPESLSDAGFEGDWLKEFIEIAVENIIPEFVEIKGILTIKVEDSRGIDLIRESLLAAESATNAEEEIEVKCFYDGAPNYRIELKAPDFKTGEEIWNVATEKCLQVIHAAGGEASASRE